MSEADKTVKIRAISGKDAPRNTLTDEQNAALDRVKQNSQPEAKPQENTAKIEKLVESLTAEKTKSADIKKQVEALNEKLSDYLELENTLEKLGEKLKQERIKSAGLETKTAELEARIKALPELEEKVKKLGELEAKVFKMAEMEAKLKELTDVLGKISGIAGGNNR